MKFIIIIVFCAFNIIATGIAIASPMYQSSFPNNGVLDDFNRPNQGPPPSENWSTFIEPTDGFRVVDGQLAKNLGTGNGYWNVEPFSDTEAYATISQMPDDGYQVVLGVRGLPDEISGYALIVSRNDYGVDEIGIFRMSDFFELSRVYHEITTGDSIGITAYGNQLSSWINEQSMGWERLVTIEDSTFITGYIGIVLYDETVRLDDFGGGAYTEPSTTPTTSVTITLTSGNTFTVNYTWTFGEMAITALLAIVVVVFCARWMYDVVIQLWSMRGDNDSI